MSRGLTNQEGESHPAVKEKMLHIARAKALREEQARSQEESQGKRGGLQATQRAKSSRWICPDSGRWRSWAISLSM